MNAVAQKKIAIYGAGGFGREVAALILQINAVAPTWNLLGFYDDGVKKGTIVADFPVLGNIDDLNASHDEVYVVFALGHPLTKKQVYSQIHNPRVRYPILIHPSVIIGRREYVVIGEGTVVCAGNILTTNVTIGRHVTVNMACTIGHDAVIGDFSSLMPTSSVSGDVHIGALTFLGTGAKIINRKTIGNNVVVGAGSVVIFDIPDAVTAFGVPAKVVTRAKENA